MPGFRIGSWVMRTPRERRNCGSGSCWPARASPMADSSLASAFRILPAEEDMVFAQESSSEEGKFTPDVRSFGDVTPWSPVNPFLVRKEIQGGTEKFFTGLLRRCAAHGSSRAHDRREDRAGSGPLSRLVFLTAVHKMTISHKLSICQSGGLDPHGSSRNIVQRPRRLPGPSPFCFASSPLFA